MGRVSRRHFLAAGAALGASLGIGATGAELLPGGRGRRVVIVGGGWGGLTAARRLRQLAPELEVVLIERGAAFRSLPMSNKWLVGLPADGRRSQDHAATARAFGYVSIRAEVTAIDRERQRVVTADGSLGYDWLVLAAGIRHDYAPWCGDDGRAADQARAAYPAGFVADELDAVKRKLAGFEGGTLVMTVPPGPYRCTPAPYERAVMIAWMIKRRKLKAKLVLVDAGAGMQAFNRVFAERYRDQIEHLTHAGIKAIDPFRKTIATEFDDLRFDDAILIPPQQAAELAWQADLVARNAEGRATGWGAVDPVRLHVPGDERIFLIGDLIDRVSPLFGHYPKTGHMASRQGRIVAGEIAARAAGRLAEPALPDSICHVFPDVDPMESVRIEAKYHFRGDGVIAQAVRQQGDPQPRGEDSEWVAAMYAEFLAPDGG